MRITDRQADLLIFIYKFWEKNNRGPKGREIREEAGYDPSWQIDGLLAAGFLNRVPGKTGGIQVTEDGVQALLDYNT